MAKDASSFATLFLCGDVMTGRGVDQVFKHRCEPHIYEGYCTSAVQYVQLAEGKTGPIPKPVSCSYIWGDALIELDQIRPCARIINLETAVTESEEYWKGKGINYRMHPANIDCISAASIDCCVLSNNHVLDWGYLGLEETLATIKGIKIHAAGAGRNIAEASQPAVIEMHENWRLLVFAFGCMSSGIPPEWSATSDRPGVNLVRDFSDSTVASIAAAVKQAKRTGDIAVASIHWGGNWWYDVPEQHQVFAHKLIDVADIDLVHGHSSHHPMGIEIYRRKPILYGCGDFFNDYEGISGHEDFRGDLTLMYFITIDRQNGSLAKFEMTPMQVKHFSLQRVSHADLRWLQATMGRECRKLGTHVFTSEDGRLVLQ